MSPLTAKLNDVRQRLARRVERAAEDLPENSALGWKLLRLANRLEPKGDPQQQLIGELRHRLSIVQGNLDAAHVRNQGLADTLKGKNQTIAELQRRLENPAGHDVDSQILRADILREGRKLGEAAERKRQEQAIAHLRGRLNANLETQDQLRRLKNEAQDSLRGARARSALWRTTSLAIERDVSVTVASILADPVSNTMDELRALQVRVADLTKSAESRSE